MAHTEEIKRHLGKGRIRCTSGPEQEAVVELNAAEAALLVLEFLDIATQEYLEEGFELLRVFEHEPGLWLGEMEPDGAALALYREGPEEEDFGVFEYDPQSFMKLEDLEWDEDSEVEVESQGSVDIIYVIKTNAKALLSLAVHMAALAQDEVPVGASIRYDPGKELTGDSLPLVFKKTVFSEDVPWAR